MRKIIKWLKEESWLVSMLIGISLLTWSMAVGEVFSWQIPISCMFIVMGIGLESTRN
jgi:hypothetical protein